MIRFALGALAVVALSVLCLSLRARGMHSDVVRPFGGEFYEPEAGGWLRYEGTLTYAEQPGQPETVTLVASAWCVDTGAGYTLYGSGTLPVSAIPYRALGGGQQFAFQGRLPLRVRP